MTFLKIIIIVFIIIPFMFALITEIIKRIRKEILEQKMEKQIEENERYRRNEISRYEQEFYVSQFTDLIYNKIVELSKWEKMRVIVYLYEIEVRLPERTLYGIYNDGREWGGINFREIGYENFTSNEELIAFSNVLSRKFGVNYECKFEKDAWNIPYVLIYEKSEMNTEVLKSTH